MRQFALATTLLLTPLAGAPARAADPLTDRAPVATVTMEARSVALGVGYTWGDGTLRYHGKTYHFTIKGLDVAAVGASRVMGRGRVYYMSNINQFSGTYGAFTGEATIGTGYGGQAFKNASGVEIRVDNVTRGAKLSGSADGFQITLR